MNRRDVLVAGSGLSLMAAAPAPAAVASVEADLRRYVGFGNKASAGPGDAAARDWERGRLEALGFKTELMGFDAPTLDGGRGELALGGTRLPLRPQALWRTTGPGGVEGRLVRWPGRGDARGAIAVVVLAFGRWSSFHQPAIEPTVRGALDAGAAGVVIVTTGPTGEILALNVAPEAKPFSAPVALLAPKDAKPVIDALDTGATARLTITGTVGTRRADNLIGRLASPGSDRWVVVSTPRSGWTDCAGERGPGIAVWLSLAEWAKRSGSHRNFLFLSTSGHEFENVGGRKFLERRDLAPGKVDLWVHLGANVAARDWHDLGPLLPLPSADPQRYLVAASELLPACRAAFAGQAGLEAPYPSETGAAGELKEIFAAGYTRALGVFGTHRFHHAMDDDMRCLEPARVAEAAAGFRAVTAAALGMRA